ncbi:MAG: helix-turn-helix transcriptional regulator [Parasporobacterium sp.]|nr:helix-turn-helix transcriptional regulator [Parasporobacterium sp.]MBR3642780.1 helix-turn-helix transcriptional regulator [Parasporobacterium sp.]
MYPLYENIRERREELDISQEELALRIGYKGKSMISKIENGRVDLHYSKIVAIAEALKTTEAALCGWTKK